MPPEDNAILRRPLDIYAPFAPAEVERMRAYVKTVRSLVAFRFFEQVPHQFVLGARGDAAQRPPMVEPDEELTIAAAARFRQLYKDGEEASFHRVMSCLRWNVSRRASPDRDLALAALENVHSGRQAIPSHAAGIGFGQHELGTRWTRRLVEDWIEAYLHGAWLHVHNEKSHRVAALDSTPIPRFTVYQVMRELTNTYWLGANIVDFVLAEPALTGRS
jgi:hypothetical protein